MRLTGTPEDPLLRDRRDSHGESFVFESASIAFIKQRS
jgi:hypothetical protein